MDAVKAVELAGNTDNCMRQLAESLETRLAKFQPGTRDQGQLPLRKAA